MTFLMVMQSCEDKNLVSIILGFVIRCIIINKSATNHNCLGVRCTRQVCTREERKGSSQTKRHKNRKWRGSQSWQIRTEFQSPFIYMFNNTFFCCFVRELIWSFCYTSSTMFPLLIRLHIFCQFIKFLSVFVFLTNKRCPIPYSVCIIIALTKKRRHPIYCTIIFHWHNWVEWEE